MTNQIPDTTIKKEWRYVETPMAAEVEVGDIRLRPHWKGLSDTDTLRAVVRMAAAAPALYEAAKAAIECPNVCSCCAKQLSAALALADVPISQE